MAKLQIKKKENVKPTAEAATAESQSFVLVFDLECIV